MISAKSEGENFFFIAVVMCGSIRMGVRQPISVDFLFEHVALLESHDQFGRDEFALLCCWIDGDAFHLLLYFEGTESRDDELAFVVHVVCHSFRQSCDELLYFLGRDAKFSSYFVDEIFVVHFWKSILYQSKSYSSTSPKRSKPSKSLILTL